MKNLLFTLFLFCLCFEGFAQVPTVTGTYRPGHFYSKDGNRTEGLLRHTFGGSWGDAPDNYIEFKPTAGAKEQKLTVQDINGFVIGQDSFTVKQNFDINDHDHLAQDFVRVVKSGALNLYLHYSTNTTQIRRQVLTYLVEKDGELYRMVRPTHFNEQFPLLVADNKELLRKIKEKKYSYADLQTVIDEYNHWHAQKTTAPKS